MDMRTLPHDEASLRAVLDPLRRLAVAQSSLIATLTESAASARRAQAPELAHQLEEACDEASVDLARSNHAIGVVRTRLSIIDNNKRHAAASTR